MPRKTTKKNKKKHGWSGYKPKSESHSDFKSGMTWGKRLGFGDLLKRR